MKELFVLLQDKGVIKKSIKKITTFQQWFNHLSNPHDNEVSRKQVGFKPIDRNKDLNNCSFDLLNSLKLNKPSGNVKSPPSKKNITFSFSNKDIKSNNVGRSIPGFKRTSIQIDPSDENHPIFEARYRGTGNKQLVVPTSPLASFLADHKSKTVIRPGEN